MESKSTRDPLYYFYSDNLVITAKDPTIGIGILCDAPKDLQIAVEYWINGFAEGRNYDIQCFTAAGWHVWFTNNSDFNEAIVSDLVKAVKPYIKRNRYKPRLINMQPLKSIG